MSPFPDNAGFYAGYTYAYPHKSAYRLLSPPLPLTEVWGGENKDALFLYIHIPFCEMRCGFCNLFTLVSPDESLPERYLKTLERQARITREALGNARFARIAIGGGTPSFLSVSQLRELFRIIEDIMGASMQDLPVSFEASPATLDPEKLTLLKERGVDRFSMGVQSFIEEETRSLGRPQPPAVLEHALDLIDNTDFHRVNLDLIYGIPDQDQATWARSLQRTVDRRPHEIYLYPLYIRPLTGLGRHESEGRTDTRPQLYEQGRRYLIANGYRQVSMRLFRQASLTDESGPTYCCQQDGMVGLGIGARSYTTRLHYCTEYAVSRPGVKALLKDYLTRTDQQFQQVDYGFRLEDGERRRRFLLQSLLRCEGLDLSAYQKQFQTHALDDFPLEQLKSRGFAHLKNQWFRLTDTGIARTDLIGPWLWSEEVKNLMEAYELT